MVFIDGTWLYGNLPRLSEIYGRTDFRIDFGKLPPVLARQLKDQLPDTELDIVRTYLFGSYAANYDHQDEEAVQRQRDFFDRLREDFHYEVEAYPIDFRGRRLRAADRAAGDTFEPREKCVDISLAASMLYLAAVPQVYDIAMVVLGDRDFVPVLRYTRMLGKRVVIASVRGSCAQELWDPRDDARVRDFDVIWIDELLHDVELRYLPHRIRCESSFHAGPRDVWTTFHPRPGQRFFCDECRDRFRRQRPDGDEEAMGRPLLSASPDGARPAIGDSHTGYVKSKMADKGYGFIRSSVDGLDYFFHLTDLSPDLLYDDLPEGTPVAFEIRKLPEANRAGAGQNVRIRIDKPDEDTDDLGEEEDEY